MCNSENPTNEPKIDIKPIIINFGLYNPDIPLTNQPKINLRITNTGNGILTGRIIPQVSWLIILPIEFRCYKGQSSTHRISISTGAPIRPHRNHYNFGNVALVSSNVGVTSLSAKYSLASSHMRPKAINAKSIIAFSLIVILFSFFLLFSTLKLSPPVFSNQTANRSELLTQGAQTMFFKLSITAASSSGQQIAVPHQEITTEKIFIFQGQDNETSTPIISPTYTPWPRDQFQNPEEFIRDYYGLINNQEYPEAWSLLSNRFQDECCNQFGSEPYYTYMNWWNSVEYVDVISAYLQEWDVNPVPVIVSLRYQYKDGTITEDNNIIYIISDIEMNSLLIDEVK